MAIPQKKPSLRLSLPVAPAFVGGIRISITNQRGQRYRYRAQAVSLNMRKGALEVVENDGGCYVWFDRCDLEIRDLHRTLHFHLNAGAASNVPGAELVILADLVPTAIEAKTRPSDRRFAPRLPRTRRDKKPIILTRRPVGPKTKNT